MVIKLFTRKRIRSQTIIVDRLYKRHRSFIPLVKVSFDPSKTLRFNFVELLYPFKPPRLSCPIYKELSKKLTR